MRVAHLTDPHVFAEEGIGAAEIYGTLPSKRWLGGLNLALGRRKHHREGLLEAAIDDINRHGYEHVILTGDLTNLSLEAEFRRARILVDRFDGGPARVTVLPGNHDAYTPEAVVERRFERAFAPFLPEPLAWPIVRELGELVLVAATTAVPTPWGFASGRIGAEQRAKIEAALAGAKARGQFRLLALHHPPVKARGTELRQLSDRAALAGSLRRYGCELVIHGHDHRDQRSQLPGPTGPIPIYGAPSVTYVDERPDRRARYNVYTIEEHLLVRVDSRDVPRA